MFDLFNSFDLEKFNLESGKPFNNAIFANGIFQHRTTPFGTFVVPLDKKDFKAYGLKQECETSFTPDFSNIPKIPYGVLSSIIQIFKDVSKTIKSEVYCEIIWDKVKKDFFIHIPEQEVSAATVKYTNEEAIYNNPDYLKIMNVHSHVNMGAFYSGVDNTDDKNTGYSGVVGKIDTTPEMVVRATCNGNFFNLVIEDIFDEDTTFLTEESDYSVPEEHYLRITERTFTYAKPATTYKSGSNVNNNHLYDDDDYYYYPSAKGNSYTGYQSPYTSIYTKLNAIRYGKIYNRTALLDFMDNCIECAAEYCDINGASVEELNIVLAEVDNLYATHFGALLLDLAEDLNDTGTTSTTFTTENDEQQGLMLHGNSTIRS